MKKKISKLLFIAVVMVSCFYFFSEERNSVETLLFDNVEALASGEGGGGYRCYNSGDIDCYGHKVDYMIDGISLD
jgi:hypothetical protein